MGFTRTEGLRRPVLYGIGLGFSLSSALLAFAFAASGSGGAPYAVKLLPSVFVFIGLALVLIGRQRVGGSDARSADVERPRTPQPTREEHPSRGSATTRAAARG